MKNNNYKEFDRVTLLIRQSMAEKIIESYNLLGWTLEKKDENSRYQDIIDITFVRPHKIENKDELQLLQVYMEERINGIGKLERHKHSFSTSYGLFFGVVGLMLAVLGVLFILNILPVFGLAGGIVFCVVGALMMISCAVFIPLIFKKEKVKYQNNRTILESELEKIYHKASILTGGNDEKQ